MGYACPVCSVPQRDGEHLAHHLAFTAMIHGDDHESWLDEHVPDWSSRGPTTLAEVVVEHAAPTEYHEVFEDTVDRGRPAIDEHEHHGHHRRVHGDASRTTPGVDSTGKTDPETATALREARALTRELLADDGGETPADRTEDRDRDSNADSDHNIESEQDTERTGD